MSILREIWNDGQGVTVPEMQRPCDVAAGADDRVFESLLASGGGAQKRVLPLDLSTTNPRLLVAPGTTNGALKLQPCVLIAGDAVVATKVKLSASLLSALQSALVGANASGLTRIDLLYATITRTAPTNIASPPTGVAYVGLGEASTGAGAQGSRKIKLTSGTDVTTQPINIYDVVSVTLTILAGTPGGGAPSLPADSASVFNFSLATISVATGYTSGSAISAGNITQTWTQATLPHFAVDGLRDGTRSVAALLVDSVGGAAQVVTSDTPRLFVKDSAGSGRQIVADHNGYPRGRFNQFYDDWRLLKGITLTAGTSGNAAGWGFATGAGCSMTGANAAVTDFPGGQGLAINYPTVGAGLTCSMLSPLFFLPLSFISLVMEFEVELGTPAADNVNWLIGLSNVASGTPSSANQLCALSRVSAGAGDKWKLVTAAAGGGGNITTVDSGQAPNNNTAGSSPPDRITIELHGSASPLGARARLFINDVERAVSTTNLPTGAMGLIVAGTSTATPGPAAVGNMVVGPIRAIWNRYASLPGV